MLAEVTTASKGFLAFLGDNLHQIIANTGFANVTSGHLIMIGVGLFFLYLAISRNFEPMLLVPIGFGILVGNIPFSPGMEIGIYEDGSVLNYLYFGVIKGIYPPLIFLGIGAMTDFSALISNPKLMLVGAAAQIGIFATYMGALALGFTAAEAGAIGIIGGADGPTAILVALKMAPELLGAIAVCAYSYMALIPIIQPPIMRLLTTEKERAIRMDPPRQVSKNEKILFPIVSAIVTVILLPSAASLIGMLMMGNLLRESGVTGRLSETAQNALINIVTILLGLSVGASARADLFLKKETLFILVLGIVAFAGGTAGGILFAKIMNLFSKKKINPLIGAAGVSAVPMAARVAHKEGQRADPNNYLLMHAMGPNVAGVIGSAVVAGIFLNLFG